AWSGRRCDARRMRCSRTCYFLRLPALAKERKAWSLRRAAAVCLTGPVVLLGFAADAAALQWKGHDWNVTSGGMAGKCQGNPSNVSVDGDGYLHLKISQQ